MKLRKKNKTSRLLPVLAAIMLIGCLAMAIGPAQARYRAENKATIEFTTRPFESIYLGRMIKTSEDANDKVFDCTHQSVWKRVDGVTRLEFAVANGKINHSTDAGTGQVISTEVFAEEDQCVQVQLFGNLNVWNC